MSRLPIIESCRLCGSKLPRNEMRLHEPGCRRERLLKPGALFHMAVVARRPSADGGGFEKRVVPVRLETVNEDGSMLVTNLTTRRTTKVKAPRRFREWMELAHIRNTGRREKREAREAAKARREKREARKAARARA